MVIQRFVWGPPQLHGAVQSRQSPTGDGTERTKPHASSQRQIEPEADGETGGTGEMEEIVLSCEFWVVWPAATQDERDWRDERDGLSGLRGGEREARDARDWREAGDGLSGSPTGRTK